MYEDREEEYRSALANLEHRYAHSLISEEEYEREIERLNEAYNDEEE